MERELQELQIEELKAKIELLRSLKYQVDNYDLGVRLLADALNNIAVAINENTPALDLNV